MSFRGTLGAMPAESLNGFLEHVLAAKVAGGQVDRIDFNAAVRGGVAKGTITPLYHGLQIEVTGRGATGIMGGHGALSNIVRSVVSGIANGFKIRNNNPEHPGQAPRSAPIDHTFTDSETLPAFVWLGLRDGLLTVIRK